MWYSPFAADLLVSGLVADPLYILSPLIVFGSLSGTLQGDTVPNLQLITADGVIWLACNAKYSDAVHHLVSVSIQYSAIAENHDLGRRSKGETTMLVNLLIIFGTFIVCYFLIAKFYERWTAKRLFKQMDEELRQKGIDPDDFDALKYFLAKLPEKDQNELYEFAQKMLEN